MLYDTRWDQSPSHTAKALKQSPFLSGLIAWLDGQEPEKEYCYHSSGSCLMAQYYQSLGYANALAGGDFIYLDQHSIKQTKFPSAFADIAANYPRTFGAALLRARAVMKEQSCG